MLQPLRLHRGRKLCCGPHLHISRQRNIIFTVHYPERPAAIPRATAERQQHLEALAAHYKQLQVWAENCPDNFENRAALVGAEIARLEGHDVDAMRLYEHAIRSARANGFVHNEALAYELAARFYMSRWLRLKLHVFT